MGEHNEFTPTLRGDVEVDRFRPMGRVANFVQADLEHLPFRAGSFSYCYAYNVLEHITNPYNGIGELRRVSSMTDCRQDAFYHIGSYASSSHRHFQLPSLRFLPYPNTRVGRLVQKWLWFFLTRPVKWGDGRIFTFGGLCCHREVSRWRHILVYHEYLEGQR